MNPDVALTAVVDRLRQLYTEFGGEHAIQFEGHWTSWGAIGRLADRLEVALTAAQVPAEAPIAVIMRQRPAMLASELALLSLGRTVVLISPLQGDRTLADDVATTAPAVLVRHERDRSRAGVPDAVAQSGTLEVVIDDGFDLSVGDRPDAPLPAGPTLDAAVTVQTSGTTGTPKRLPVTWDALVELGGGPDGWPARSDRGAIILSLPLVTIGGLLSVSRLIFRGRPLAMMERFDVHTWVTLVKEHRPKVIGAPPPVVKMILDADISADDFEGVTAYMTGSAAVPVEIAAAFRERYGIPVLVGYGATEFLNSVSGWTADLWTEFGRAKEGSAGRPHPGVRLRVLDPASLDDGEPTEVAPGEEGILEVDPPQRAGGLPDGWIRTNDRARIDDDGFLWILGRADDVIVRGGFKVDLNLVADAIRQHPDVIDAACVGLADDRVGTVPGALVVTGDGIDLSADSLRTYLRELLAPYAVPSAVRFVDAIPRTSTLKHHKSAITTMLKGDD